MIDGTMPGVKIRDLPRLLAAAVFAALLSAGCSAAVPGDAAPPPRAVTQAPPPGPATPGAPEPPGGCQVTATSTGSISSSGRGGRTSTINGRTSFSCGDGPMLAITAIDAAGVTFAGEDGATVTIAPGTVGVAGGYSIDVARVAGGAAEFQVLPE
jgi:hypothetical protein